MAEERLRLTPHFAAVGVLAIEAEGVIDAATAPLVCEPLLSLSNTGLRHFVIDLRKVREIDGPGLRQLTEARSRIRARGGSLALTGGAMVPGALAAQGISRKGFVYATVAEAAEAVAPVAPS
ncbi:STAS domain-containing protein [Streptomyces monticola]|uniref:STAS domain-containing protein n=1 Tax=Streptomyces monticola TaxID=2666263 RepID=A0ABW2JG31_9ACTN